MAGVFNIAGTLRWGVVRGWGNGTQDLEPLPFHFIKGGTRQILRLVPAPYPPRDPASPCRRVSPCHRVSPCVIVCRRVSSCVAVCPRETLYRRVSLCRLVLCVVVSFLFQSSLSVVDWSYR